MQSVAVAGATGHAGKGIIRALSARGVRILALVRAPERLGPVRDLCDEYRTVEVTGSRSIRGSLDGVEGLISAVGKTRQSDPAPRRLVDVDANRNLFIEAARAGAFLRIQAQDSHLHTSPLHAWQLRVLFTWLQQP